MMMMMMMMMTTLNRMGVSVKQMSDNLVVVEKQILRPPVTWA